MDGSLVSDNILSILGIQSREDAITNLLLSSQEASAPGMKIQMGKTGGK